MHQPSSPSRSTAALLLAVVGCVLPLQAPAQSATARLEVRVRIPPVVHLRVLSHPAWMEVTEADVARGYVEVGEPMEVEVVGNLRHGVRLAFLPSGSQVRAAHPTPQVALTSGTGMRREVVQVRLRLDLATGARAGRHAWPVQVSSALP